MTLTNKPSSTEPTTRYSPGQTAPIISVCNVSKMYPLYADPRDRLKQSLWYALPEFLRGQPRQFYREFWALRNVSFDIHPGETVGVIGRNGSGKSTLLQIIAGTLNPTAGEVQVSGRVAALLELGSGFNMEFTGRENVYMNGSILGLSQEEIDSLYDDIMAFAGIGQFIDQPVKLYSSGMVVRLAFAVQAFVPKQILIVDEALAVGDEAFQRKCMGVLEKFRNDGGTVLLVTHDTQTIVRQCERCLLLNNGELIAAADSKPVTDLYQKLMYCPAPKEAEIISVLRQSGLQQALSHSLIDSRSRSQSDSGRRPETSFSNLDSESSPPRSPDNNHTRPADPSSAQAWFDPHLPQPSQVSYGNGHAEIFDYGMYTEQAEKVNILVAGRRYQWTYWVRFYQDAAHVNFGMMLKGTDGLDVAGIASNREGVLFDHIGADSALKITFLMQMNVTPGTYFLNCGVDGYVDNQTSYLHRLVDVTMVRVIPCDAREPYGVAYLAPTFEHEYLDYATS